MSNALSNDQSYFAENYQKLHRLIFDYLCMNSISVEPIYCRMAMLVAWGSFHFVYMQLLLH